MHGVEVIIVSPRYSSQTCHCCLHIGLRSGKRFKCTNAECSWHGDADLNASIVLSIIGASVSKLRGSEILSCELSLDDSGLLQHQGLADGQKPLRFSQR